jgi:hypothetical protein
VAVERHHVDRDAHAERVDRTAPPQQEPFPRAEVGAAEEAARPFAPRLGHRQPEPADPLDPHAATVAPAPDTR